jgi:hypothetical protein
MSYQIDKVANGYMVRPGLCLTRNYMTENQDIHVFPTLELLCEFLAEKFGEKRAPSERELAVFGMTPADLKGAK